MPSSFQFVNVYVARITRLAFRECLPVYGVLMILFRNHHKGHHIKHHLPLKLLRRVPSHH